MTDATRAAVVELLRAAEQRHRYISDIAEDPVINRIARDAREYAARVTTGARNTDEFYWMTCLAAADQVELGNWP